MKQKPVFKTKEARQKIIEYYDMLISGLAAKHEEKFVETSYGKTHVVEAGSKDEESLVLLHGSVSNSAMWLGDIPVLAQGYHVAAIDIVGEAGKSEPVRHNMKTDAYALWLSEVIEGLGIEKPSIIGNSFGGWLALKYASVFPQRAKNLVLIAPSGIVGAKLSFVLKSIAAVGGGEKRMLQFMEYVYGTKDIPKQVIEYTEIMMDGFNPMVGGLPVFSGEQLSNIDVPMLFMAGENDVTMDAAKAASRIKKLVPRAQINLVENCGHAIYNEAEIIKKYLKEKG